MLSVMADKAAMSVSHQIEEYALQWRLLTEYSQRQRSPPSSHRRGKARIEAWPSVVRV